MTDVESVPAGTTAPTGVSAPLVGVDGVGRDVAAAAIRHVGERCPRGRR